MPNGEIAVVLSSNKVVYIGSKTHSYAGLVGFDFSLVMYCSESLTRLSDREGSSDPHIMMEGTQSKYESLVVNCI